MATTQQYSLRWNNYYRHLTYAMENQRQNDDFVDVSLFCDGKRIKAHKVVLSSCSSYFKEIFKENPHPHPVIIFKFIKFEDLNSIIEFMYQGEVNVQQEALQSFLQTAELLAVQGLTAEEKEKQKPPELPIVDQHKIIKTIPSTIRAINEPIAVSVSQQSSTTQTIEIPTATILQAHATQTLQQQPAQQQQQQQHQIQHIQVQQQTPQQQHQQQVSVPQLQHHPTGHHQQQQQPQQQHHQHHHQHQQLNTTTNTVTLTTPNTKKRKITFSDEDDNIYTAETVDYAVKEEPNIVKATEMTFLRGTVKLDMPEYIVSDVEEQHLSDGATQPSSQDGGSQNVTQYTSEYEILTESEIDEKYPQAESENADISIEMGRLLNPTNTNAPSTPQANMDETSEGANGVSNTTTAVAKTENKSSSADVPLVCKVCKRKLQSINALRRHTASKHSAISARDHECVICNRKFKTSWSLSTHNSRFHRDMRPQKESIRMEIIGLK